MENKQLVHIYRGIKEGNRYDFQSFFNMYFPRLLYYAQRFVEKTTAEDLVQDVFVYVWENRKKLEMGESFISFLYESVYHKALNVIRREKMIASRHDQLEMAHRALRYFTPYDNPVFEKLIHDENYEALQKAIEELPERGRMCIKMTYLHGMKIKEVAELLRISSRTVEAHLYTSIKTLRQHFHRKDKSLLILALVYFSL